MTLISPRRLSITIGALLVLVASLVTALVTAPPARAATGDMVISGVIDGPLPGGVPKAVEFAVVNDIADLSDYGFGSANNGGGSGAEEFTFAGSASAGDYLYVATDEPSFTAFFGFAPTATSGSAPSINGDDAIELFKDGTVVDVFGDVDVDGTGQPWEYLDGWAYRLDDTGQDGASFELGNWTFSGPNALDGETTNGAAATPFPLGTWVAEDGDGGGGGGADYPADLLLTEVVVTPTAGEFVEIHNTGATAVDLSDVYLTDATFAGGGTYYYNIVTGTNAGGGGFGDFTARFPDGASIASGEYQTVAMSGSSGFLAEYGTAPTYELFDDGSDDGETVMREALPGSINGQGGLTNDGEVVVLFAWDGAGDVVGDLDYVVWGDKAEAVDKTGVATDGPDTDSDTTAYLPDTAVSSQDVVADSGHANGESWQRADLAEGTEAQSGGNGAAGSDETSENLSMTWCTEAPTPGAAGACDDGGGGGDDPTAVKVHELQGDGPASPLVGEQVELQVVVTSLFTSNDELDAFFVQEEDADADANAATSEGVFVFCRGFCPDVAVGDQVTVTGAVEEYFGMTQVAPAGSDDIVIDASGVTLPAATAVTLPTAGSTLDEATFESIEGMVVTFPETLAVSEYFELARYGQLVLTTDERPFQFTHDNAPSVDGYAAFLADLETRRIILDDDNNTQNDPINGAIDEAYPYPSASWPDGGLSLDNTVRGGDTVDGLTGVMHWSFAGQSGTDAWRIRPIDGYDYTFDRVNERTDAPDDVGGSLKVASFNVLNYFTSIDGGGSCPSGGCRGADSDAEFVRQQDKIVAALAAIDADVVGLIEIENNDTAVANLAAALNAVVGADTYAPVETGIIGTDAIKVGFIHKTATVDAVGDHAILDSSVDPRFVDTKNRPALAQTFREVATGGEFTAAVNHLKSKGSDCTDIGEDESIVDGQANCSETRNDAAAALVDWLADDPTGSGDGDAMILGDLNAYRMEDAIVTLEDAGYTDLNESFGGDDAYSYVFDGQLGYLDYAMTNPDLTGQVTGATRWLVNADEVPVLDYNDAIQDPAEASFERESDALPIYAPDPYRSSDHDPVVVGLDLEPPPPEFPAWDPDTRYGRGDVVLLGDLAWEATRPNRNKEPGAKPNGPWQLFGVDYSLTVLHNNDGESDLLASDSDDDPGAGTISRFAWLVRNLQRDALRWGRTTGTDTGVVTVSAGDNFLASPEWQASLDRGVPYYDALALDRIGYDAFTIGNHEFDFGPDVLANFIESFRGGDDVFLSANLDFSAEPALQALVDAGRIRPSVVVEEQGERVGIIGVTTPELPEVTSPGDVIINDDLVGVVQTEVDRMTADGVDKILVSSHLQDIENELDLVTELTDVDAVIGGGGGEDIADNYPLVATDAEGQVVPVVTVPGDYFDVGQLQLHFDDDGEVVAFGGGLVPVTSSLRQDPFILRRIEQPVERYLDELSETIVATSQVGLNGVRGDVRSRETNVGNLMADGMLASATSKAAEYGVPQPDIALQNGGGIRNDSVIPAGSISALNTFDIAPFTNFVAVVPDVARDDVVAAIEHGLAGLPGAAGSFGQWGGMAIEYDPDAPAGSRVLSVTLDDGTVIADGTGVVAGDALTLATIDFLAQGNDGYDMFEPYDFTRIGVSYQQSLSSYLSALGTVTAADYADPVAPADRTRIIPVTP